MRSIPEQVRVEEIRAAKFQSRPGPRATDKVVLVTRVRWQQLRGRHVTGQLTPDDVTPLYPTGRTVPAGRFRPAQPLPNRMTDSQVLELALTAAIDGRSSEPRSYPTNRFGVDSTRIVVSTNTNAVLTGYPRTGPDVYRWNGTERRGCGIRDRFPRSRGSPVVTTTQPPESESAARPNS